MADDNTQDPPATSEETGKTPATTEGTTPPAGESADKNQSADKTQEQKLFTQADLDRIAANVRTEEKRKFDKKASDDKAAADQAKLKESGEFKTLYEQAQARVAELEGEVSGERLKGLRAEVAAEHKLPKPIADLLQGDTRDALTAHAKELAKVVVPARAPINENGEKRPDSQKLLDDETARLKQTGRYGGL